MTSFRMWESESATKIRRFYSVGHLVFWTVWGMGAGFLFAIFVFNNW